MKKFSLKAVLITLLLFTSIFTLLSTINVARYDGKTYSATKGIMNDTAKLREVGIIHFFYVKGKENEAEKIINDKHFSVKMDKTELTQLLIYIDSLCIEKDIEYEYVKAIIANESRWSHTAVGASKDYGLMQITPIAAKQIGYLHGDVQFNPKYNVKTGIKLLTWLKNHLYTMDEVLVAYNAGIGSVKSYGPSFVQNHKYLRGINSWIKHY